MGKKDAVWGHVANVGTSARYKCNYCKIELHGNPTYLKEHITGKLCKAPADVKKLLLAKLEEGRRPVSKSAASSSRRDKRSRSDLYGDAGAGPSRESWKESRSASGGGQSVAADVKTAPPLAFFSSMNSSRKERATELCARWLYREGLPFRFVESNSFKMLLRSVNPVYSPPSRPHAFNELFASEFKKQKQAFRQRIQMAREEGVLVLGGDGFSERLLKGIIGVVLFTPDPVYIETRVWPEQRKTAYNIHKFFGPHIEKMGARNAVAFVSDTEPTMQKPCGIGCTRNIRGCSSSRARHLVSTSCLRTLSSTLPSPQPSRSETRCRSFGATSRCPSPSWSAFKSKSTAPRGRCSGPL